MVNLPDTTLVCVDDIDPCKAIRVLLYCSKDITFGAIKLFTSHKMENQDDRVDIVPINHIETTENYSNFLIRYLPSCITTDYMLIVQRDGFIVNPSAWEDAFKEYDYIGAPWFVGACAGEGYSSADADNCVGNGGFSLRSTALMRRVQELSNQYTDKQVHPEDVFICRRTQRELLREGFTFAPPHVAHKFSLENNHLDEKYSGQFGWHGWRTRDNNPELDCVS